MKNPISENIRLIREGKGYSQEYVAKKIDVTQQAYSQMEKNPDMMTLKRLRDISKILDVDIVTLLGEDNVYVQQNYNQRGGHAATKMMFNAYNNEEKDLYERLITELKEEINHLRKS